MGVGVGILGAASGAAIAEVGQRAFSRLADHPILEIRGVLADTPEDVGKSVGDIFADRWMLPDETPPAEWADAPLLGHDADALRDAGIQLILSALPVEASKQLEPELAAQGFAVVSGSGGLRKDADVPLVTVDVNNDHLQLVHTQRKHRGWDTGFVVVGPVCTASIAALVCRPIIDAFGIDTMIATSMQAVSGSGLTGLAAMKIADNVLPYINGEEEKFTSELEKVFGTYVDGSIDPSTIPISATCTRVPVRYGHTISMTLGLSAPATADEVTQALADFRSQVAGPNAPLTPETPIWLSDDINRPQPFFDAGRGAGRVISVGRVREQSAVPNGVGLVVVGHNHERGTWGNVLMLCESVVAAGLVG